MSIARHPAAANVIDIALEHAPARDGAGIGRIDLRANAWICAQFKAPVDD
jgi:hypothetical protein